MDFDYDLFVIGAGPGGLAAAQRAAAVGVRVAIAERSAIGGACVNYGCVPEKLMTYAAQFATAAQDAAAYGWDWKSASPHFNWARFTAARNQEIQHLNQVHLHKLQKAGVELIQGHAAFLDLHTLTIGDRQVTAEKILISVGAKPETPNVLGAEHTITWPKLFNLEQQPQRIAIVGNGYISVKFAGILSGLGCQVTQLFLEDRILSEMDHEVSQAVQAGLSEEGVQVLAQTRIEAIERMPEGLKLSLSSSTPLSTSVWVDAVLVDVGSVPALEGLNLAQAGVETNAAGAICVDRYSCTSQSNIFAVGDCTNRKPLTPVAIAEATAFVDSTFGNQPRSVNYEWVPVYVSSRPEAATVGMSEAQAQEKFGDAVRCYRKQFEPLFYNLTARDEMTLIKLVVDQRSSRILGIHMVGKSAIEIVQSLAVSLSLGATIEDFRMAIGIHPSLAEEFWSI